ncbi:MAG: dihydropyrimidinase [Spirochaetaceae bacterium]|jgi:dihydropyrimidinase|nr:dihydropyrimidinase [Spirochaetaceae bacterium]
MDVIVKNGTIVTGSQMFRGDIGVERGKIAVIADRIAGSAGRIVDAEGLYVLPGGVDVHTHLDLPVGDMVSADSYQSGTRAAVCGGVTTVFDYPTQLKGKGIIETVAERQAMAESGACCDYAFHCAVTDLGEKDALLEEFQAAADYGVTSFKCYMVYRKAGLMVDDGVLLKILAKTRDTGTLTAVHAENHDALEARIASFVAEGKTDPWHHYLSRPEFVEAEAVKRAIHWAEAVRAGLYVVHLACKEGLEAVAAARMQGLPIFAETCPQYLEFTHEVYTRALGRNFVCSPPIKGPQSRDALWQGIQWGIIDTVATDHCPFTQAEKDRGIWDFTKIPNGCAGVENRYPYMLSAANTGRISFSKAVEVCAEKPAAIFGCTDKGSITVGKDADLVLYDPKKEVRITAGDMHSDVDHTIWEGLRLKGYPVQTFLRGELAYDNGRYVGVPGMGRYIKRGPSGVS